MSTAVAAPPNLVLRDRTATADLHGWCGYNLVDLRSWTCPDCDMPLPAAARTRLSAEETKAPPGWLWVLDWIRVDCDGKESHEPPLILGLFTDRSTIARKFVRAGECDARHIRQIHWYQHVAAAGWFEGWDEETDSEAYCYSLILTEIDQV